VAAAAAPAVVLVEPVAVAEPVVLVEPVAELVELQQVAQLQAYKEQSLECLTQRLNAFNLW
jgi:hypothetical protein